MTKEILTKLETALKKTLCPSCPSDASVYVYKKDTRLFVREHSEELEYVAIHRRREIRKLSGVCAVIKATEFGTTTVSICPDDECSAEFRIKDDRIVRVDMYGNPYQATEWLERFVPAFSEAMGGLGRFHD